MASPAEVVALLRARNITSPPDADVAAAWADPRGGPPLAAWARAHLTPDTLLSADELALYAALQRSGRADRLAADAAASATTPAPPLPPPPPLRDADLSAAIAALDRSTAELARQTDTLRQQQDAVARLEANPESAKDAPRSVSRPNDNGDDNDPDALARTVDARAAERQDQAAALAVAARQAVDAQCRAHDVLLASLQKLAATLPAVHGGPDEPSEQQDQAIRRLRDACLRLIQGTVEAVRTKLDRVYVEAVAEAITAGGGGGGGDNLDVPAVQAELESLYAEILPVAQMAVEQPFLAPALRAVARRRAADRARARDALVYVAACLRVLREQAVQLGARVATAHSHQAATAALVAAAHAEMAVPVRQAPPHSSSSSVAVASPVKPARGTTGRPLQNNNNPSSAALDQLLLSLSLSLPEDDIPAADNDTPAVAHHAHRARAAHLAAILAARAAKADAVAANVQTALAAAVTAQLADARRAVGGVRAAVAVDSDGDRDGSDNGGPLVDPEIHASTAVLADEVARVRAALAAASADAAALQRRPSAHREQLVARWGGGLRGG